MDWDEVMSFFFEAEMEGYVSGDRRVRIPDLPGFKSLPLFRRGSFSFRDLWSSTPNSPWSTGMTMICDNDEPIWYMSYSGPYDKGVLVFLRHALLAAYEAGEFFGGRGQPDYREGLFVYRNHLCSNDFTDFAGREEIFSDGISRGWHTYRGHSLLPTTDSAK